LALRSMQAGARMRLSATDAWRRAAVSDGWSVRLIS
jgi:hypothetical protein